VRVSGARYSIRYYDASGRQRWETIGPNRKEAETVLHQRLYEVRSGKYPIIARRTRITFATFVEEWEARHLVRVRASTAKRYRELVKHQLLPAFGDRSLSAITAAAVETFVAEAAQSGRLAPKTVNHALALFKQLLAAAMDWGYLTASPVTKVRKFRLPRRPLPLWTPAEIWRFLLSAEEEWRAVWLVGIFTGLRPGEVQAMAWQDQNWPDFTSNRIHVTTSYEARSRVLGAPKTDRSVRDVDMVPTVRRVLEILPGRGSTGLVSPGVHGGVFPRSPWRRAWDRTILAAKVPRIRPYDLRHAFASLLIAAGKNPLYIARQLGHYSAGFTLGTYGHLMEALPRRQVEFIDEIVFPEGWEAALKLHLSGALQGATGCSPVLPSEGPKPLENAASSSAEQSDVARFLVDPYAKNSNRRRTLLRGRSGRRRCRPSLSARRFYGTSPPAARAWAFGHSAPARDRPQNGGQGLGLVAEAKAAHIVGHSLPNTGHVS
jgi:integrase